MTDSSKHMSVGVNIKLYCEVCGQQLEGYVLDTCIGDDSEAQSIKVEPCAWCRDKGRKEARDE